MKFDRLRVLGFKSFVEPMEFILGDGLTGVVGPNGCGKSNLVEALRWVMGENSYKNMRASGMDDVIFSGSANRPPRNAAEVTLFLDNRDRSAPPAYNNFDSIEVSRHIEREAGSTYRINGQDVRARDVQLLFADASTGARSPAMVRQGQIGELISQKPTARRKVLEEASGISGLHSRRNESEMRLRAAESNLVRLEDMIGQVDTQVISLGKQARQARRYKNLSSDIRKAEATILYMRWSEACESLENGRREFAEVEVALRQATAKQASAAREQALVAHRVPQFRGEVAKAEAFYQELTVANGQLDAVEKQNKERTNELSQRQKQLETDIRRERKIYLENSDVLENLAEELEVLTCEEEGSEELWENAHETAENYEVILREKEVELSEQLRKHAGFEVECRQLEVLVEKLTLKETDLNGKLSALLTERYFVNEQLTKAVELNQAKSGFSLLEEKLSEAEKALDIANVENEKARVRVEAALVPLAKQRSYHLALKTEAKTLEEVLSSSIDGRWQPLADQLNVFDGYEVALAAALSDAIEYPLNEEAPAFWAGAQIMENDPPLPNGCQPLSDFVDAPAQLSRALAQIGFVENDDALCTIKKLQVGQLVVSRSGAVRRWDGVQVSAEVLTPAAQRMAQRNRLAALNIEVEDGSNVISKLNDTLEKARHTQEQAENELLSEQQQFKQLRHQMDEQREQVRLAEERNTQFLNQQQILDARITRDEEDLKATLEEKQNTQIVLENIVGAQAMENSLDTLRAEVEDLRDRLTEVRAKGQALVRERDVRNSRRDKVKRDQSDWKRRQENAREQVSELEKRLDETCNSLRRYLEEPEHIAEKRLGLATDISKADSLRKQTADNLLLLEKELREKDQTAKEVLELYTRLREEHVRAEERLASARLHKGEVEGRIYETLDLSITELAEQVRVSDEAAIPEPDTIERRLVLLKAERERLGGVNLQAEEELTSLEEQLGTLVSEREDLIEAIKRLRGSISTLNREARKRLLTAFDVVDGHFQRLFQHLFGGGEAQLKLIDSEDPLEAGLEIFARPPGKKPQTMTLLSGGEQALTALALIFAVFLTNPTPICVLDEVDAPLDDANVERYCALLEDVSDSTQTRFAVITHNPITMSRMDCLFGVTMSERGVSQLVSVNLQTAESYQKAS
ncbi:chromosome segregation protein SMC [Flexibacterium corallicola]|uniref:chromosome segregation protein SMC n=1 Tax=Flexibacterium corallicola TaxID=3037259 RepID=UPI00286ED488|nr:chromosome segregation protein SMC [Pseudovibrio sp. M1P-2-3]